jgi:hypothetical protein
MKLNYTFFGGSFGMNFHIRRILNFIIFISMIFAVKANANVELQWAQRGCEDAAEMIGKIAVDLEAEQVRILIETEPRTPARIQRLKSYKEKIERVGDILSRQRNELKKTMQDTLARDRIELWYGGAMAAVDLMDVIIGRRIDSSEFGATSERYRRLIEDECRIRVLLRR